MLGGLTPRKGVSEISNLDPLLAGVESELLSEELDEQSPFSVLCGAVGGLHRSLQGSAAIKFQIMPLSLDEADSRQLGRALKCIGAIQSTIEFELVAGAGDKSSVPLPWPHPAMPAWQMYEHTIAVSSRPFLDNWFSHSCRGLSIVSTAGWSENFAPPGLASFIMTEIALSTYTQIADSGDAELGPHQSPIGCLFDFCIRKTDISWKMRCGSLCAEHEGRFKQHGGSAGHLSAIQRILEAVRLTAFGRLSFDNLPRLKAMAKVFIGSSTEMKDVAYALQRCIEGDASEVECSVWTDGIFTPGKHFLTSLLESASKFDFAVLVAGRDDAIVWRGEKLHVPRDNVTFELGLFIGTLGMDRTFIVCPEHAPKLPSDLDGVTQVRFGERDDGNLLATVRPSATTIIDAVRDLGRKDRWTQYLSPTR
jgi:hypothetical protein